MVDGWLTPVAPYGSIPGRRNRHDHGGGESMIRFHLSYVKRNLLEQISRDGVGAVLKDWEGTQAEAIDAILDDSRESFVIGECDNQGMDGSCQGHKTATTDDSRENPAPVAMCAEELQSRIDFNEGGERSGELCLTS